jgi:hypothetical protein
MLLIRQREFIPLLGGPPGQPPPAEPRKRQNFVRAAKETEAE